MNIITPEAETQPPKSLSFTNGAIKRHHYPTAPALVISYKECLKNHAASLGGHALDGCGEFMPSPSTTPTDPTSIKCAACGCHRNFHRREPEENTPIFDFPPPQARCRSPNSGSPPPLSSSYYPSAPHMLLALSAGVLGTPENYPTANGPAANGRKRFRSKFSQEQKEKMYLFSEKVGWKMQKSDEGLVEEFCNEVGVGKGVLKVWMHNNKHTLGKKDVNGSRSSHETNNHCNDASAQVATNASSSSS